MRSPSAQFVSSHVAASAALAIILCFSSLAAADVMFVGSVNPDPPAAGGVFSSTTDLVVGDDNDTNSADPRAWLSVDDGTTLQYGSLIVGDEQFFFGQVVIDGDFLAGKNTKFNFSTQGSSSNPAVQIGNEGTGQLTVRGGSTMTLTNSNGDMSIGHDTSGVGYTTITDQFTILEVPDNFFIGRDGIGQLNVLNGADVHTLNRSTSSAINIGTNATGVGSVVVDGNFSILRSAGSLVVGGLGQGSLTISNGGMVEVNYGISPTITVGPLGRLELDGGALVGFTPSTGFGTTVNGYLGGSGLVRGSVSLGENSSVEANQGDLLRFDGTVSNQGSISINSGEVDFLRTFTNNAQGAFNGPGRISLNNGTVRFKQTLTNNGVLSSAHGTTNIYGQIDNPGNIVVARDSVATFYGAVTNTGTITVKPGGNALFLTDLSFVGLSLLQLGVGTEELSGGSAQLTSGGVMTLGGTLEVTFEGGYAPLLGESFELLSAAGGIVGSFDSILLPLLPNNLEIGLHYTGTSVMLEVGIDTNTVTLAGDYNNDGTVNAADYSVWRNSLGTSTTLPNDTTPGIVDAADYQVWKSNFGHVVVFGSGGAAVGSAPEPGSLLLALGAAACMTWCRRRQSG